MLEQIAAPLYQRDGGSGGRHAEGGPGLCGIAYEDDAFVRHLRTLM
jgi:hypothetical protein